jgi:tetratricopeptide (TPR) repeat protein
MASGLRFLGKLKRRSVFKVAAAYVVSSWLLLQVAAIVVPAFGLPDWTMRGILIALIVGFPMACGLAWAYELTADGVVLDRGDDMAGDQVLPASDTFGRLASWETLLVVGALGVAVVGGIAAVFTVGGRAAPHLAVLPFRVVGSEPDADVLAAGLVESFTSTVTQFGQFNEALWVVPAAEITEAMTPSAARQRFGVSLVLAGSIQFDRNRVRLTLNLIDAETERQIRSRQFDVRRQNVIDLQDEATRQLAGILDLKLSPQQASLLTRGQTFDPDARRLYLQGRGILRQATSVEATDDAIVLFQRALLADTAFALAHAGLGEAYWKKYRQTEDIQWVEAALHASNRSLAIDSTLAPVWVTLGIIRSDQRHMGAAIEAFERALAIDSGNADAMRHLATAHRRQGQWDRAESTYRRAIALRPEYWKGYNLLGAFYYSQGRYEEAVDQYQHGLQLAPANPSLLNNVAVAYWEMERLDEAMTMFERILALDSTRANAQYNLATTYFYRGRFDDAARLYARTLAHQPHDHGVAGALADAQWWSTNQHDAAAASYQRAIALAKEQLAVRREPLLVGSVAQYYTRLQQPDSARIWLQDMESLVDSSTADVVTAFALGELHESLGNRDRALTWMRRALDRGYGWIQLTSSPWLANLRTEPRVQELIRQHERKRMRETDGE